MEVKKQFTKLMQRRTAGLKLVLSLRAYRVFVYGVVCAVGGLHNEPSINFVAWRFSPTQHKNYMSRNKTQISRDVLMDIQMAETRT
jgi:hypothetical protein